MVCWLADLITRTSGRPCRHPEKSYANEFNAACWSLEECCLGCVKATYSHGQIASQKGKKKELAGRSGGQGFGEFLEVRWINSFFWRGGHTYIAWKSMYVDSRTYLLEMLRYAAHVGGSRPVTRVAFVRTELVRKVFLWTVVESMICTNVGDRTGTSTQLTHLIAWFVRSCLRWACRLMIAALAMREWKDANTNCYNAKRSGILNQN